MKQLLCGVMTFLAMVLDCSFMIWVMPFGIHPSLTVCVALAFGIADAPFTGAMAGLFAGLMMDVMYGPVFGYYSLIFLITAYGGSALYRRAFSENTLFPAICMAGIGRSIVYKIGLCRLSFPAFGFGSLSQQPASGNDGMSF